MNKKKLLLTHGDDLDGRFCTELLKLAFLTEDILVYYIANNDKENFIQYTESVIDEVSEIYLSDIEMILANSDGKLVYDKILTQYDIPFTFVDHHLGSIEYVKTVRKLGMKATFIPYVRTKDELGEPASAAFLFYEMLKVQIHNNPDVDSERLYKVLRAINDWDIMTWKRKNNQFAKTLQLYYSSETVEKTVPAIVKECVKGHSDKPVEECFNDGLVAYEARLNELIEFSSSFDIMNFNNQRILFMTLPKDFKQEYKVPCIRDMLNIKELNLDYIFLGEKGVMRVFVEKESINVNDLIYLLWGNHKVTPRATNYYSCRTEEVAKVLDVVEDDSDEGWKDIFKAIQGRLLLLSNFVA